MNNRSLTAAVYSSRRALTADQYEARAQRQRDRITQAQAAQRDWSDGRHATEVARVASTMRAH